MERKIGEVFTFRGKRLKVVRKKIGCKSCFFQKKNDKDSCDWENVREVIGHCTPCFRDDYKDVIFKPVE